MTCYVMDCSCGLVMISFFLSSVDQTLKKVKDQPTTCEIYKETPPQFFKRDKGPKTKTVAYSYSVSWVVSRCWCPAEHCLDYV